MGNNKKKVSVMPFVLKQDASVRGSDSLNAANYQSDNDKTPIKTNHEMDVLFNRENFNNFNSVNPLQAAQK